MNGFGNLIRDTVAGARIISAIPVVLIVVALFVVARMFVADDQVAHAESRRGDSYRPVSTVEQTPGLSIRTSRERPGARLEGQFIDIRGARSASGSESTRVAGDFLSDLSLAFDRGLHSGLVYLDNVEEQMVFQEWRRLIDSSSLGGLTLTNRKVLSFGLERYEVGFHGTPIRGWILVLHNKGRWFIMGVGNVGTEKSRLDEATLHMLERLKAEHDGDPLYGTGNEDPYGD